jgi:hypothetical protein
MKNLDYKILAYIGVIKFEHKNKSNFSWMEKKCILNF